MEVWYEVNVGLHRLSYMYQKIISNDFVNCKILKIFPLKISKFSVAYAGINRRYFIIIAHYIVIQFLTFV